MPLSKSPEPEVKANDRHSGGEKSHSKKERESGIDAVQNDGGSSQMSTTPQKATDRACCFEWGDSGVVRKGNYWSIRRLVTGHSYHATINLSPSRDDHN